MPINKHAVYVIVGE